MLRAIYSRSYPLKGKQTQLDSSKYNEMECLGDGDEEEKGFDDIPQLFLECEVTVLLFEDVLML